MTDTFVDAGKFAMCSPALDSYMPEICAMTIMTLSADKQALFQNATAMEEVANESMFKMIDEMKGMLPILFYYDSIFHVTGTVSEKQKLIQLLDSTMSMTGSRVIVVKMVDLNLNFNSGMLLHN